MKIVVSKVKGGWTVHDGAVMGPFLSRQRAIESAEGIVESLREHGEAAELVLDEESEPSPV